MRLRRRRLEIVIGNSKITMQPDKLEVGEPIQAHIVRGILSP